MSQVSPPLPDASPAVAGVPRLILQAEGAVLVAAAVLAYAHLGQSWLWFAVLFLAPDLSMLFYLAGSRVGAAFYNAAHTTLAAFALGGIGFVLGFDWLVAAALILAAHIGFDRLLGYGLKYGSAFGDTHLGRKGRNG